MLGLYGIVATLQQRLRIYARTRSITINLPNANENDAGLRGSLLVRRVRRRCFRRLLKRHWLGGWGRWLTREVHWH